MYAIAIIITALSGQPLAVLDWPRPGFMTEAICQATLSKPETLQTTARLGAEFAATTGEANGVSAVCYPVSKGSGS